MMIMSARLRRTVPAVGLAAAPAAATVPVDEGRITVGDPWGGPARELHVSVTSACTELDGVATPTLQVSTHDPVWEAHLQATLGLSSDLPVTHTEAGIYWHNRDTGETDGRVGHGINGAVRTAPWEVAPGLTDVEVFLTQSPGLPVEIGPVRSHTNREAFSVTVIGCPAQ